MMLPILYKKDSKNSIRMWSVMVIDNAVITEYGMINEHGVVQSKQKTTDVIKTGKNVGKINATTPEEQAVIQAKQEWEAKIKKGYVEDISGETKLPSINPMLANKFEDRKDKVKYPAVVQPKLDGFRCIAICTDNDIKLYTRTRKLITTVPHINTQLLKLIMLNKIKLPITFDGELYNHEFKDDFNQICSLIKRDEQHTNSEMIQYHIYDIASHLGNTIQRMKTLEEHFTNNTQPNLIKVKSDIVLSYDDVEKKLEEYLELGYEGLMFREIANHYENKRSNGLLKLKVFDDDEFTIIGVNEGTGKLMGHVGSFQCITKDGVTFDTKMTGAISHLKELYEKRDSLIGKELTVKYFQLTDKGRPRFPVGKEIR